MKILENIISVISRKRYYLVVYGTTGNTFGRVLVCCRGRLDIRSVEKDLCLKTGTDAFVMSYLRLSRRQYEEVG